MIEFTATIKQFANKGEKTGWTYIQVPKKVAPKINPVSKKSFRVKGKLDAHVVKNHALLPIGNGNFIIALNASMRKKIRKVNGEKLFASLEIDTKEKPLSIELLECMADEPKAIHFFNSLPKSHQRYFSNWIMSAKSDKTKADRISRSINALVQGLGFSEMLRLHKREKEF